MKNILTIENGTAILLSNVDDGTNTIFINGEEIPASSWVGSGVYQYTESGVIFTIQKTNANTGNIMLQLVQGTAYRLVKQFEGEPYNSGDPLGTDLANDDYMPFYDASAGTRKNSLWSNIVAKIKAALGIASSGTSFLRKDGTWATPANTTYTFATGDSNGQIKVTPSGGTAQNVGVKGLGSAAYAASTSFAVSKFLTDEDLNDVTTPGFYNAAGSNTCANTGLASGTAFGLEVVHTAGGSYYWQIINPCGTSNFYRRVCNNGTWSSWTQDNYTNTWRPVQNNLTSTATDQSLSANQGRLLATGSARDATKVSIGGGTMTGNLRIDSGGSETTESWNRLYIGNNKAVGEAGNRVGVLTLFAANGRQIGLIPNSSTATGEGELGLRLPASAGTLALTSQIPSLSSSYTSTSTTVAANSNAVNSLYNKLRKRDGSVVATHVATASDCNIANHPMYVGFLTNPVISTHPGSASANYKQIGSTWYVIMFKMTSANATLIFPDRIDELTANGQSVHVFTTPKANPKVYGVTAWYLYRNTASEYYLVNNELSGSSLENAASAVTTVMNNSNSVYGQSRVCYLIGGMCIFKM